MISDTETAVRLGRVSNDDIRVGTERLRREPGVLSVQVTQKQRRGGGAPD